MSDAEKLVAHFTGPGRWREARLALKAGLEEAWMACAGPYP